MKVLVVAANTERINLPTPPLGAAYVAAAARGAGHDTAFLDLMGETDPVSALVTAIEATRPQAIGLSVRNIDDQDMAHPTFLLDKVRPLVAACRDTTAAPVVLGGAGLTLFREAVLLYLGADYGICGEGEESFPDLLHRLEVGAELTGVPGLIGAGEPPAGQRATVALLDRLPDPGADAWANADLAAPDVWIPVQTRRGCPYRCSYCSTPRIEGGVLRCRAPRLVARQVERMAAAGVRQIQFVDNVFNVPHAHAVEACRRIAELEAGVRWQALVYPRGVDEELVGAMAAAGCCAVSLGFEAGDDRMLRSYGKRFSADEVRQTSDLLAAHGIRRFGFLLLGGPGETRDTVTRSFDFVESLELDSLKVTVGIRIYPGTDLARVAAAEGIVAPDDDLLHPRFYMTPDLEEWIDEEINRRGLEAV